MDKDIILEFLNVSFRYKTDDKYSLSKNKFKDKARTKDWGSWIFRQW